MAAITEISLLDHVKSKKVELSHRLQGKTIIYLDTNRWIDLKDESLRPEGSERPFYDLVAKLVGLGKTVFPISEITFYEVLKRSDKSSLKQTIEIIDRFSQGIALVTREEMMHLEFRSFLDRTTEKTKDFVWAKIPFVSYPSFLSHPGFKMGFNASVDRHVIDRFWNSSFADIFAMLDKDGTLEPFVFKDNVTYFNTQKEIHKDENKTFDQMFLSELGGTLDLFDDIFSNVMQEKCIEETGRTCIIKDEDKAMFRNLIYHAFRLKKISTELPALRISSALFANNRWDKTKSHDENDTMDFFHAAFALPYCDYFFTEKSLGSTLKQSNFTFDKIYSCGVYYKQSDILNILESL